ncbi:hypothetical protein U8P73_35980 (plasmid) [Rhizobium beringeri]|uniref:hypothetical protein n=1 Tax=Rhizobium beringeri TaxID=3019934 RepID=UPI002DDCB9CE|nr:hypothetical protein [Rhizobium beringeri]WSG93551.1 hypothetical protein U8P73_35980 [Rhizobium beringeri]
MPDLPAMTDKNLKVIIEEASGASLLENVYRHAAKALNDAEKELVTRKATASAAQSQLDFIRSQLVNATVQLSSCETNKGVREADIRASVTPLLPVIKKLKEDVDAIDKAAIEAKIADCDSKIGLVAEEQKGLTALDKTARRCQGLSWHVSERGRDALQCAHPRECGAGRYRSSGRLPLHVLRPSFDR